MNWLTCWERLILDGEVTGFENMSTYYTINGLVMFVR